MAAPTLQLTFKDMQLRVAEYLGIAYYGAVGDQVAQVPTDVHDLDLLKRCINDGYARFITSHDRWYFLSPTFTITFDPTGAGTQCVAGDGSRYFMPKGFFGSLITPFTFGTTGPRRRIDAASDEMIRELNQGISTSGDPLLVALRPLPVALVNANGSRWEAVFYPKPTGTQTVTAQCAVFPEAMTGDAEVTVCGYEHDRAVLAAALAEAEKTRRSVGAMEVAFQAALVLSKKLNSKQAPRSLGVWTDPSDGRRAFRPYTGVDTYNGNPV